MDKPTDEEIDGLVDGVMDSGYAGPSTSQLTEVSKAQLIINKRLIVEIDRLRESIDKFRYWSIRLTSALILLSFALLIFSFLQYLALS